MADTTKLKKGNGLNGRSAFVVAVASAILGSISGPILLVKFGGETVARPDPFTGTQAAALERRLDNHLEHHPDIENRFDARLTALEVQYSLILANQNRIIGRLDRLAEND